MATLFPDVYSNGEWIKKKHHLVRHIYKLNVRIKYVLWYPPYHITIMVSSIRICINIECNGLYNTAALSGPNLNIQSLCKLNIAQYSICPVLQYYYLRLVVDYFAGKHPCCCCYVIKFEIIPANERCGCYFCNSI